MEFRYGLPRFAHIIHDAGYVVGLSRFLLHETGIVPAEQFIVDNTPAKYQQDILDDLLSISEKRKISAQFIPDAGKASDLIRDIKHEGRGLIIGASWDSDLAKEKDYCFVEAANPLQTRLVLTTNYVGYTGALRVIEDVYNNALERYR